MLVGLLRLFTVILAFLVFVVMAAALMQWQEVHRASQRLQGWVNEKKGRKAVVEYLPGGVEVTISVPGKDKPWEAYARTGRFQDSVNSAIHFSDHLDELWGK